ncbi:retrovirus-related pol polyprotein from transposon TNT 1-94 [Tanacetum coccineum]
MDSIIPLGQKNTLVEYMILSGADNRPPMLDKDLKKYAELFAAEKIQADCDMKATNIILQGLPADIYSLVNHHRVAKDLWERVQLLMQGTSLTKQERECKLYDAFDKFTHIKGESLHKYYLRFTQLINDMNIYNMKMEQFQLHAYLEQHELHANEVRLLRERNQDPLAFVANQQMTPPHFNTYQSSYNNPHIQQQFPPSQYGLIHPSFAVPVFSQGDDLIAYLNKAMDFLTAVASSSNATSSGGNNANGQARVVKCYNCQGEGHMSRQCTQPKRPRNTAWYKDKAMLAKAQEAGQILDEEQLAFLADPGTEDHDTYDFDCDDISNAKAVLMANISNYGSDVISEVPYSETYLNDMENQSVHAMQNFEQTPAVDFTDNEIHSDSDIISYS